MPDPAPPVAIVTFISNKFRLCEHSPESDSPAPDLESVSRCGPPIAARPSYPQRQTSTEVMRPPVHSFRRTLMHPGPAIAGLAGIIIAVSPYVYSFGDALGVLDRPAFLPQPWTLLAGCLALAVGGFALNTRRVWDQVIITAGVAAILASIAPALVQRPSLALAVLLLAIALVFAAWESGLPFQLRSRAAIPTRGELAGSAARTAAITAAAADLALSLFFEAPDAGYRFVGLGIVAAFALRWSARARQEHPRGALAITLVVAAAGVLCSTGSTTLAHSLIAGAALLVIPASSDRAVTRTAIEAVMQHPAGPLVSSFLVLCAFGALLLHIPAASTIEGGIPFIDAVFTAVSAVCVTGLIVRDTPNDFTVAGQAAILLLIQLGGLGIMSYSAAVIIALGKRLRLREESVIASSINATDRGELRGVLKRLLGFTFLSEAIGAVLLAGLFHNHGDPPLQAVWRGIFTSISAFCNSGFALQSDSLIPYQQDAPVLHIVGILIILGGLSPAAALAIPRFLRNQRCSAQVKLILTVAAILLAGNFALIAAFEWNAALGHLPLADRLHNAWLQSVTLRTAGFNSIAFDSLRPATLLIMMVSMFIGGSPGGTAGGIKTTTAAVMLLSIVAAVRRGREISAFGRRISTATVDRAAAITTLGMLSLFLIILALLLTQPIPMTAAMFEAVSALATVGLSIGGTGQLDSVGKLIVVVAMFAGRVGPLSVFALLAARETSGSVHHPVAPIDVG